MAIWLLDGAQRHDGKLYGRRNVQLQSLFHVHLPSDEGTYALIATDNEQQFCLGESSEAQIEVAPAEESGLESVGLRKQCADLPGGAADNIVAGIRITLHVDVDAPTH